NDKFPDAERVAQVLEWLRLPEGRRPSFLTLYFSDVDSAGHEFGPDAPQTRDAVMRVDTALGALVRGVESAQLGSRVHYLVVSDHGMAAVLPDRLIALDDFVDVETLDILDRGPVLEANPRGVSLDALAAALRGRHPALAIYRNSEIPARLGLAG